MEASALEASKEAKNTAEAGKIYQEAEKIFREAIGLPGAEKVGDAWVLLVQLLAQLMEDRRSGVAPPCVVTSSGSPAAT